MYQASLKKAQPCRIRVHSLEMQGRNMYGKLVWQSSMCYGFDPRRTGVLNGDQENIKDLQARVTTDFACTKYIGNHWISGKC